MYVCASAATSTVFRPGKRRPNCPLLVSLIFLFSRHSHSISSLLPPLSCNFTSVQSEILSCDVIVYASKMSCFAVSRLLKHKEDSPSPPPSAQQQPPLSSGGPEGGGGFLSNKNGHFRSRKANNSLPNVEIVQEMPRESSMTPVPPSSPQHQHQYQYQYHHQQYPPRHMSPHRSCGGSVPPSPALSGCRSPSRQRNTPTYSTLEVSDDLPLVFSAKKKAMQLLSSIPT